MNIEREAAAAKRLLDKADASEAEANECRWKAAEKLAVLNGAGVGIKELGRQVGRDPKRVRTYIQVWHGYAEGGRTLPPYTFNECERMLAVPADERDTVKERAAAEGVGLTRFIDDEYKVGRETKVNRTKRYLADPEVAAAVVADNHTRVAINRAKDVVDTGREQQAKDETRHAAPALSKALAATEALAALTAARRKVMEAVRSLESMKLTGTLRSQLDDELVLLENAVTMTRAYIDGGDVDKELRELLAGDR